MAMWSDTAKIIIVMKLSNISTKITNARVDNIHSKTLFLIEEKYMKDNQKDVINKSVLNETALSLNNGPTQHSSFLLNRTFVEKSCPLHSHEIFSTGKEGFNSSLRLLNGSFQPEQKHRNISNKGSLVKKLAFGSTEQRKVKIFQIDRKVNSEPNDGVCFNNVFVKSNRLLTAQLTNKAIQTQNQYPKSPQRVGFGVCLDLNRFNSSLRKKLNPGPGAYEICQSFNQTNNKKFMPTFGQAGRIDTILQPQQSLSGLKSLGRTLYPSEQSKDLGKARQKWKEKIAEKRLQLAKIMPKPKQKFVNLQQKAKMEQQYLPETQNRPLEKKLKDIPQKSPKLFRVLLKEKTNSYLPQVDPQIFKTPHICRGPSYKYLFSNSFMPKNDHAFEAHSFKPQQPQSQYIYLKGKFELKPKQNQSCCFRSKAQRILF